jgi:hypothetical protein
MFEENIIKLTRDWRKLNKEDTKNGKIFWVVTPCSSKKFLLLEKYIASIFRVAE